MKKEAPFCGIGKIPAKKKRGTSRECLDAKQVRYYGMVQIDPRVIIEQANDIENDEVELMTLMYQMKRNLQYLKYETKEKKKIEYKKKLREWVAKHDALLLVVAEKKKQNKLALTKLRQEQRKAAMEEESSSSEETPVKKKKVVKKKKDDSDQEKPKKKVVKKKKDDSDEEKPKKKVVKKKKDESEEKPKKKVVKKKK